MLAGISHTLRCDDGGGERRKNGGGGVVAVGVERAAGAGTTGAGEGPADGGVGGVGDSGGKGLGVAEKYGRGCRRYDYSDGRWSWWRDRGCWSWRGAADATAASGNKEKCDEWNEAAAATTESDVLGRAASWRKGPHAEKECRRMASEGSERRGSWVERQSKVSVVG